jgi:hypothetical protein
MTGNGLETPFNDARVRIGASVAMRLVRRRSTQARTHRRWRARSGPQITDYDGKNFGNFSNDVKALLVQDASHPGKLQAAHNYVTPGAHDDTPPPKAQLKVALGDLRKLKADYLD